MGRTAVAAASLAAVLLLWGWAAGQEPPVAPPALGTGPPCWPPPCTAAGCDRCEDALKSACPDQCEFFLRPPRMPWYVVADGAALRRDPERNFHAAALDEPGNIVLSTGQFKFDFKAGGRLLVGHTCGECFQIECLYLGVTQDDDTLAVRNTTPNALGGFGNLFSPFGGFGVIPQPGLDYNNFAQIRYTSWMQSAELNLRRQLPTPNRLAASVLFGVRYVGLPEEFDYFTQSDVPGPLGTSNSIHVATNNQMVGPQIGGLFELYIENRWWLNFEAKAALLNNHGEQSTSLHYVDNTGVGHDFFGSRRESHTAYLADLAATFIYRWSPHCSTRLGYQAIWLNNVALAPDNFNTDINILTQGPAQLNFQGRTVYHGPYAGISLSW